MANSSNRQKEIFLKALDFASSGERAAFLAQACAGDEAMRRQIDAMLQAHGQPDSFLEKPAAMGLTVDASNSMPMANILPDAQIGSRIGPYKLLEQIGEGGMGAVYMAEQQEPVRRLVALKLIKPGMDSGQILARFEAERQALAMMDHPNIAKVLDAGATGGEPGGVSPGRPYFVMELVKGTPITTFCDANQLPPRKRLELFVRVCQAIQHAHQKGIIHRDIKPSNVLVALYDNEPVPKVIDFGIAKAAGQPLSDRTLQTGFGAIVGTLEYMSPEQAQLNQLDVDTRSDIYSLGVLLYELLTGSTPLGKERIKHQAMLQVLLLINEEEPLRPSVKLSSNQGRASITTHGSAPEKLSQLLRGEIDWIVMKSLEKDRNRRYDTAASLAKDVERYLKDELVEARPPSVAYRLQKAFRKNRGVVVAASLIVLALLGGVIGTTVAMFRAWDAEDKTSEANKTIESNLSEVNQLNEKLSGALISVEKERDRATENEKTAKDNEKKAVHEKLRADTSRHAVQMDAIFRAWERDDMVTATRILDEAPKALRQTWEYRFLRDLCRRQALPMAISPANYQAIPMVSAISPDGKAVVGRFHDGGADLNRPSPILVLDAATGLETSKLAAPTSGGGALCFSADGRRLAYSSFTKRGEFQWNVIDFATRRNLMSVVVTDPGVFPPELSPDGSLFAINIHRIGVKLFDVATAKEKLLIPGAGSTTHRVAFSPDGKRIAVAESHLGLNIYTVEGGKKELALVQDKQRGISAYQVSFSPDGKWIIAHLREFHGDFVRVFDAVTGKEKFTQDVSNPVRGSPYDVGFAHAGKSVVIVHLHPITAQVFDLETGKDKLYATPLGRTTCRFVDAHGERILVNEGPYVFLRSLSKVSAHSVILEGLQYPSQQIGFFQDTKVFARLYDPPWASWDATTGKRTHTFTAFRYPTSYASTSAFSADGLRVAYWDNKEKLIKIFDTHSGKVLDTIPRKEQAVRMAFSPDSKYLLWTDGTSNVVLLDTATKQDLWELQADETGMRVAFEHCQFSPDGRVFAAVFANNRIDLRDAKTGQRKIPIQLPTKQVLLQGLLFSADGNQLVAQYSEDGRRHLIKVWDTATGTQRGEFYIDARNATRILLSPDGTRLAFGNDLYDIALGQRVFAFPADHAVQSFSRDGRRILASYRDQKELKYGIFDAP